MKNDNLYMVYNSIKFNRRKITTSVTHNIQTETEVESGMETIQAHRQSFKWMNGYNTARDRFNGIWGGRSNHNFPYNTGHRNALYLFSDGWVLCNSISEVWGVCAFYKEYDKRSSQHVVWRLFVNILIWFFKWLTLTNRNDTSFLIRQYGVKKFVDKYLLLLDLFTLGLRKTDSIFQILLSSCMLF